MTEKDEAELNNLLDSVFGSWGKSQQGKKVRKLLIPFITRKQQELVESILAEIPDGFQPSPAHGHIWANLKWLKQLIRDKYGK